MLGSIYQPYRYGLRHATGIGPWKRSDVNFDAECRELFELFGGEIVEG